MKRYRLSFTAAGLSLSHSNRIAETYRQTGDWETTKTKVIADNLLQSRTLSSARRMAAELIPRLQTLNTEQLEHLATGDYPGRQYILWYANCRRYEFIGDFAREVLHEKYLNLDLTLTEFDYRAFFNRKADWHPELEKISDSTRRKIKTVLFRMLREAGLLTKNDLMVAMMPSSATYQLLFAESTEAALFFPFKYSDWIPS